MKRRSQIDLFRGAALGAALLALLPPSFATAGNVSLKSGLVIEGHPVEIEGLISSPRPHPDDDIVGFPIVLITTPTRRYFVPDSQVVAVNKDYVLGGQEVFRLKQQRTSRKNLSTGRLREMKPLDQFGHRTMELTTPQGAKIPLQQAVTEIRPDYVRLITTTHDWEFCIDTNSIRPEILDGMIRVATDQKNAQQRLAIARFYLQAGMYPQSTRELSAIVGEFPELKATADEVTAQVRELQAKEWIEELARRKKSGQQQLAYDYAKRFPVSSGVAALREAQQFIDNYEESQRTIDKIRAVLGDLQGQLNDSKLAERVAPLRSLVSDELDLESLDRLSAFLKLSDDRTLPAADKLALAYSGWILGSANAITDLQTALQLWNARFLVVEYLRSDNSQERQQLLEQLKKIEGVSPSNLLPMVPNLPMAVDTEDAVPGIPRQIEFSIPGVEVPFSYSVLLPPEYNPHHRYPLIVGLRPALRTTNDVLEFWGGSREKPGQAARHGYIVIAPRFVPDNQREYDYSVSAHRAVIESLVDARKRFNVDSDRIFLAGHGMGGDAAFDIGMSHPDFFAGVIPVSGLSRKYSIWYWGNTKHVPFYIVSGELDRDLLAENAKDGQVNRMMTADFDVTYCQFIGHSIEPFYSEIPRLFEWMNVHRRVKDPATLEATVLRPTDNRFYWIESADFPRNVLEADVLSGTSKRISPMKLTARITPGNTVRITSGAKRHTIWLTPEMIDLDKPVNVKVRDRQPFGDFVQPRIETLLEDLRVRGDRQLVYSIRIDVK